VKIAALAPAGIDAVAANAPVFEGLTLAICFGVAVQKTAIEALIAEGRR
jgi:hypothetical protein